MVALSIFFPIALLKDEIMDSTVFLETATKLERKKSPALCKYLMNPVILSLFLVGCSLAIPSKALANVTIGGGKVDGNSSRQTYSIDEWPSVQKKLCGKCNSQSNPSQPNIVSRTETSNIQTPASQPVTPVEPIPPFTPVYSINDPSSGPKPVCANNCKNVSSPSQPNMVSVPDPSAGVAMLMIGSYFVITKKSQAKSAEAAKFGEGKSW